MGFLDSVKEMEITAGVALAEQTPGSLLIDVRSPQEYSDGHLAGSINLPLQSLKSVEEAAPDKSTPLFIYCLSGGRSKKAARALGTLGYTNVTSIGGVNQWNGPLEKS